MRRTFLCLLSSLIMYCFYIYTLPAQAPAATAAVTGDSAQISADIVLPSKRLYAVTLGIFDTEDEARLTAAGYALRGSAALITETQTGWTILGAGFNTNSEAASVCAKLRTNENIDASVMLFSADEVHLSMTSTAAQADSVSAALMLLSEIPAELSALSAQLDSGTCNTATVQTLISARTTEASGLLENLSNQLGTTADIFCRMVETSLTELTASLTTMSDGPTSLTLSSLMKQCALETVLNTINMMRTLD